MMQVNPAGQAGSPPHVTSHKLERPQVLHLSPQEAHILEAHAERIHSWGWSWHVPKAMHEGTPCSPPAQQEPPSHKAIGALRAETGLTTRDPSRGQLPACNRGWHSPAALQRPSAPNLNLQLPGSPASGDTPTGGDAVLGSDEGDSEALAEMMLVGAAGPGMHRAAKRRRLAGPDQQQTRTGAHGEQHVQKDVCNQLAASAAAIPAGRSCSETTEAGHQHSIVLTDLACVLSTSLNATELQVCSISSPVSVHKQLMGHASVLSWSEWLDEVAFGLSYRHIQKVSLPALASWLTSTWLLQKPRITC